MIEHRVCSLCMGQNMVSMTDGRRAPCPACSPTCCTSQPEPVNINSYQDQCSISANIAIVEPVVDSNPVVDANTKVRISRSEQMKRNWIARKAKDAEAVTK